MSRDHGALDELELFRLQAEELGFGHAEDFPELTGGLETADEFVARMKETEPAAPDGAGATVVKASHRFRRARWVLAAAGVAAAAAVVVAVVRPSSPAVADLPPILDSEFATATTIAYAPGVPTDESLDLLIDMSKRYKPDLGVGDVQYRKSDDWFATIEGDGSVSIVPRLSENWILPNGSIVRHEKVSASLSPDGRGVTAKKHGKTVEKETLEPGSAEPSFVAGLSDDPRRLASQLLDHIKCPSRELGAVRAKCLFSEIRDIFSAYVVRPELTTAMWRMLKLEKGFRSLGGLKDRAGRHAESISFIDPADPTDRLLILGDIKTGAVIGFEDILIKTTPDLKVEAPAVLGFSTFLTSKFVKSAPKS